MQFNISQSCNPAVLQSSNPAIPAIHNLTISGQGFWGTLWLLRPPNHDASFGVLHQLDRLLDEVEAAGNPDCQIARLPNALFYLPMAPATR
eukprot:9548769-Alexandrium_andersonii.AAC.1